MMYQAPGTGYNNNAPFGVPYPTYQNAWTPTNTMNYTNYVQPSPQQTTSQPMPQQQTLLGRMVDSPADIRPNEVPMDGAPGIFPLNDFSGIVMKSWNSDGTISTVVYQPVPQEASAQDISSEPPAYVAELSEKLDAISNSLPDIKQELESLKKAVM